MYIKIHSKRVLTKLVELEWSVWFCRMHLIFSTLGSLNWSQFFVLNAMGFVLNYKMPYWYKGRLPPHTNLVLCQNISIFNYLNFIISDDFLLFALVLLFCILNHFSWLWCEVYDFITEHRKSTKKESNVASFIVPFIAVWSVIDKNWLDQRHDPKYCVACVHGHIKSCGGENSLNIWN